MVRLYRSRFSAICLLFSLAVVPCVSGRNLGHFGNRTTSVNSPTKVDFATVKNVTTDRASCPVSKIKITVVNGTLDRRSAPDSAYETDEYGELPIELDISQVVNHTSTSGTSSANQSDEYSDIWIDGSHVVTQTSSSRTSSAKYSKRTAIDSQASTHNTGVPAEGPPPPAPEVRIFLVKEDGTTIHYESYPVTKPNGESERLWREITNAVSGLAVTNQNQSQRKRAPLPPGPINTSVAAEDRGRGAPNPVPEIRISLVDGPTTVHELSLPLKDPNDDYETLWREIVSAVPGLALASQRPNETDSEYEKLWGEIKEAVPGLAVEKQSPRRRATLPKHGASTNVTAEGGASCPKSNIKISVVNATIDKRSEADSAYGSDEGFEPSIQAFIHRSFGTDLDAVLFNGTSVTNATTTTTVATVATASSAPNAANAVHREQVDTVRALITYWFNAETAAMLLNGTDVTNATTATTTATTTTASNAGITPPSKRNLSDVTAEGGASCPKSQIKISVVNATVDKRATSTPAYEPDEEDVDYDLLDWLNFLNETAARHAATATNAGNTTLRKRALSYNDLAAKGSNNILLQAAHETQVEQSMWTSDKYDQLAKYGWVVINKPSFALDILEDLPMSAVGKPWPQGIGMVSTAPPLVGTTFIHAKESTGLAKKYNPTFASYTTAMDLQTGVIATLWTSMWEPQRSVVKDARRWKGGDIAPLSQWNDVVFLQWSRLAASMQGSSSQPSAKVNYIMFNHVIPSEDGYGQDIVNAVFEALKPSGNPGPPVFKHKRTFSYAEARDSQGFRALLGTRAGTLVTKFLSEHKGELGVRRVSDISVFAVGPPQERFNRRRAKPCLIFKIVAAPLVQSGPGTTETTPGLSSGSGPSVGDDSHGAVTPVQPGGGPSHG